MPLNDSEKSLVQQFFTSTLKLLDAGIVRSDKILGDLGEWLCVKKYGLKLEASGRHPGFDGYIGSYKVQVKVHNSPKGTNLSVGNPDKYDEVKVLIGPKSLLRVGAPGNSFHVYQFSSDEVKAKMKRKTGYYCAKGVLREKDFDELALE